LLKNTQRMRRYHRPNGIEKRTPVSGAKGRGGLGELRGLGGTGGDGRGYFEKSEGLLQERGGRADMPEANRPGREGIVVEPGAIEDAHKG